MSLSGDIITEPLWVDTSGAAYSNAQIWNMLQGEPTTSPIASTTTFDEAFLNDPNLKLLRRGDFFGDGFASPLILDPVMENLGIWAEPLNPNSTVGKLGYFVARAIPAGYQFAGVGDFNGDGVSDVFLWNQALQQGLVLTLEGSTLVPIRVVQPAESRSQMAGGGHRRFG